MVLIILGSATPPGMLLIVLGWFYLSFDGANRPGILLINLNGVFFLDGTNRTVSAIDCALGDTREKFM